MGNSSPKGSPKATPQPDPPDPPPLSTPPQPSHAPPLASPPLSRASIPDPPHLPASTPPPPSPSLPPPSHTFTCTVNILYHYYFPEHYIHPSQSPLPPLAVPRPPPPSSSEHNYLQTPKAFATCDASGKTGLWLCLSDVYQLLEEDGAAIHQVSEVRLKRVLAGSEAWMRFKESLRLPLVADELAPERCNDSERHNFFDLRLIMAPATSFSSLGLPSFTSSFTDSPIDTRHGSADSARTSEPNSARHHDHRRHPSDQDTHSLIFSGHSEESDASDHSQLSHSSHSSHSDASSLDPNSSMIEKRLHQLEAMVRRLIAAQVSPNVSTTPNSRTPLVTDGAISPNPPPMLLPPTPAKPPAPHHAGRIDICFLSAAPIVYFNTKTRSESALESGFTIEHDDFLELLQSTDQELRVRIDIASWTTLSEICVLKPRVLHVSCHGGYRPSGEFYLAFERENGKLDEYTTQRLRDMLGSGLDQVQLVFVNACYSLEAGRIFSAAGVPWVVAVHSDTKILDKASVVFARSFYHALLSGEAVPRAFHHAGRTLRSSQSTRIHSCCCSHSHKRDCPWHTFASRRGPRAAHAVHVADSRCRCPRDRDGTLRHTPACLWLRDYFARKLTLSKIEHYDGCWVMINGLPLVPMRDYDDDMENVEHLVANETSQVHAYLAHLASSTEVRMGGEELRRAKSLGELSPSLPPPQDPHRSVSADTAVGRSLPKPIQQPPPADPLTATTVRLSCLSPPEHHAPNTRRIGKQTLLANIETIENGQNGTHALVRFTSPALANSVIEAAHHLATESNISRRLATEQPDSEDSAAREPDPHRSGRGMRTSTSSQDDYTRFATVRVSYPRVCCCSPELPHDESLKFVLLDPEISRMQQQMHDHESVEHFHYHLARRIENAPDDVPGQSIFRGNRVGTVRVVPEADSIVHQPIVPAGARRDFIGRNLQMFQLLSELWPPANGTVSASLGKRFMCVTGPERVGKDMFVRNTAQYIYERRRHRCADGVLYFDVSTIASADDVFMRISERVDVQCATLRELCNSLRNWRGVLVFGRCESLLVHDYNRKFSRSVGSNNTPPHHRHRVSAPPLQRTTTTPPTTEPGLEQPAHARTTSVPVPARPPTHRRDSSMGLGQSISFQDLLAELLHGTKFLKIILASPWAVGLATIDKAVQSTIQLKPLRRIDTARLFASQAGPALPLRFQLNPELLIKERVIEPIADTPAAAAILAPLVAQMPWEQFLEELQRFASERKASSDKLSDGTPSPLPDSKPEEKLHQSLSISIDFLERTHPDAFRLLFMLAMFPGGLTSDDLDILWTPAAADDFQASAAAPAPHAQDDVVDVVENLRFTASSAARTVDPQLELRLTAPDLSTTDKSWQKHIQLLTNYKPDSGSSWLVTRRVVEFATGVTDPFAPPTAAATSGNTTAGPSTTNSALPTPLSSVSALPSRDTSRWTSSATTPVNDGRTQRHSFGHGEGLGDMHEEFERGPFAGVGMGSYGIHGDERDVTSLEHYVVEENVGRFIAQRYSFAPRLWAEFIPRAVLHFSQLSSCLAYHLSHHARSFRSSRRGPELLPQRYHSDSSTAPTTRRGSLASSLGLPSSGTNSPSSVQQRTRRSSLPAAASTSPSSHRRRHSITLPSSSPVHVHINQLPPGTPTLRLGAKSSELSSLGGGDQPSSRSAHSLGDDNPADPEYVETRTNWRHERAIQLFKLHDPNLRSLLHKSRFKFLVNVRHARVAPGALQEQDDGDLTDEPEASASETDTEDTTTKARGRGRPGLFLDIPAREPTLEQSLSQSSFASTSSVSSGNNAHTTPPPTCLLPHRHCAEEALYTPVGNIAVRLAECYMYLGQPRPSVRAARFAATILDGTDDIALVSLARIHGQMQLKLGNTTKAIQSFSTGIELAAGIRVKKHQSNEWAWVLSAGATSAPTHRAMPTTALQRCGAIDRLRISSYSGKDVPHLYVCRARAHKTLAAKRPNSLTVDRPAMQDYEAALEHFQRMQCELECAETLKEASVFCLKVVQRARKLAKRESSTVTLPETRRVRYLAQAQERLQTSRFMFRNLADVAQHSDCQPHACSSHEAATVCKTPSWRRCRAGEASALKYLSLVFYEQGRYEQSIEFATLARKTYDELGDGFGHSDAVNVINCARAKLARQQRSTETPRSPTSKPPPTIVPPAAPRVTTSSPSPRASYAEVLANTTPKSGNSRSTTPVASRAPGRTPSPALSAPSSAARASPAPEVETTAPMPFAADGLVVMMNSSPLVQTTSRNSLASVAHHTAAYEWDGLQEAAVASFGQVQLRRVPAQVAHVRDSFNMGCRVLHISSIGHADFLSLETGGRSPGLLHRLYAQEIPQLLSPFAGNVGLVFLNLAFSVTTAESLSAAFVRAGVPHVIASTGRGTSPVGDFRNSTSHMFMREFYAKLFSGEPVGAAFRAATSVCRGRGLSTNEYMLYPLGPETHDEALFPRTTPVTTPLSSPTSERSLQSHADRKAAVDCSQALCQTNVHAVPARFQSRNVEMFEAARRLLHSRFLNLYGISGIGTTSLARAVAHYLRNRFYFRDGIYFIDSSASAHRYGKRQGASQLRHAISVALNLDESSNASNDTEELCRKLRGRDLLFVVDGLRGVDVSIGFFLDKLLAADVSFLVTSNTKLSFLTRFLSQHEARHPRESPEPRHPRAQLQSQGSSTLSLLREEGGSPATHRRFFNSDSLPYSPSGAPSPLSAPAPPSDASGSLDDISPPSVPFKPIRENQPSPDAAKPVHVLVTPPFTSVDRPEAVMEDVSRMDLFDNPMLVPSTEEDDGSVEAADTDVLDFLPVGPLHPLNAAGLFELVYEIEHRHSIGTLVPHAGTRRRSRDHTVSPVSRTADVPLSPGRLGTSFNSNSEDTDYANDDALSETPLKTLARHALLRTLCGHPAAIISVARAIGDRTLEEVFTLLTTNDLYAWQGPSFKPSVERLMALQDQQDLHEQQEQQERQQAQGFARGGVGGPLIEQVIAEHKNFKRELRAAQKSMQFASPASMTPPFAQAMKVKHDRRRKAMRGSGVANLPPPTLQPRAHAEASPGGGSTSGRYQVASEEDEDEDQEEDEDESDEEEEEEEEEAMPVAESQKMLRELTEMGDNLSQQLKHAMRNSRGSSKRKEKRRVKELQKRLEQVEDEIFNLQDRLDRQSSSRRSRKPSSNPRHDKRRWRSSRGRGSRSKRKSKRRSKRRNRNKSPSERDVVLQSRSRQSASSSSTSRRRRGTTRSSRSSRRSRRKRSDSDDELQFPLD